MGTTSARLFMFRVMVAILAASAILATAFALLILDDRLKRYTVLFPDRSIVWSAASCLSCVESKNDGDQPGLIDSAVVKAAIVNFNQRKDLQVDHPWRLLTNRISEESVALFEQAQFCDWIIESTPIHGARISAGSEFIFSLQSFDQDPLAEYYLDNPANPGTEMAPCTDDDAKLAEPLMREVFGMSQ